MKLFISHSSKDIKFVNKLAADLRGNGFDLWVSENEILVADSIIKRMNEGLKNSSLILAVLSKHSIASPWVTAEIDLGIYEEIVNNKPFVIPLILDSCDIPPLLKTKRHVDFRKEYPKAFKELNGFLKNITSYKMESNYRIGTPVKSKVEIESIFKLNKNGKELTKKNDKQRLSDVILESECLRKGNFKLTSGILSNYYIMPRKILESNGAKDFLVTQLIAKLKKIHKKFDAILYPALTDGGLLGNILADKLKISKRIPIHISHDKREINLQNIDVKSLTNLSCLYVDDVITSGKSLQLAISILIEYGIIPKCVATLFCRDIEVFQRLENEMSNKNIDLTTLFFASIPPYKKQNLAEIKVETIN
jgi:orotate phosphoribosyltransferase